LKAYVKEEHLEIESVDNILVAVKRIERVVKQAQLIAMIQMGLYELKKSIVDPEKIFKEFNTIFRKYNKNASTRKELKDHGKEYNQRRCYQSTF